jgi:MFS family permease
MDITKCAAKTGPLLNKMLLLFMLAMILANLGGEMYGMLLPLYLKELNASVVQIGLFFTVSQIIPLVVQILGGWISDSLGRLRSIAIGSLAGNLVYVGFIFAPTWQWVMSGMFFSAITRSLIGPSFSAFIAEQSSEKNRARVFGISDTLFMVVGVIGPPLGGFLADTFGFRIMLVCAWFLYFLATVLRVSMARTAARGKEANPQRLSMGNLKANLGAMTALLLSGGVITWVLITDGVRDIAYSLSGNLMPVYLDQIGGMSYQQIGWLGLSRTMRSLCPIDGIGFLTEFIAMFTFMQVKGFWGYALVWAVFGLGTGMMSPAYNSLISKAVPEKMRGTAFGLFGTSLGLVSLPAPWLGARLWERYSPRMPFYVTGLAALASAIPAWFKFRLPKDTEAPPTIAVVEEIAAD